MYKDITLVEWLLIIAIVGVIAAIILGKNHNINVVDRCLSHGYVPVESAKGYTKYCSKVENGNTIVIHADSLRAGN